jgi:hypothetical protein
MKRAPAGAARGEEAGYGFLLSGCVPPSVLLCDTGVKNAFDLLFL